MAVPKYSAVPWYLIYSALKFRHGQVKVGYLDNISTDPYLMVILN